MLGVSDSLAPRLAWALEQEATFLRSLSEWRRGAMFEDRLKYVFPVVRRAVEHLGESETKPTFALVYAAVSESVQVVAEAANEIDPTDFMSVEMQTTLSAGLADRLHAALLSFPG
jgi:hypothetical protein